MNVSLTTALEKYVQNKVSSGLYTSASEVIRESLRLMRQYEEQKSLSMRQLNQAIDVGLTQLEKGEKISAKESYHYFENKIKTHRKK